ncbi:MAG: CBS domain-containing protein [Candidatus Altiarchaeota archaeon]|nr:CBS domain-containing protein [Candidatus Altiarchaeota archaeon]
MIGAAQREILEVLIELYDKKKDSIKGEDISQVLKRSPGTIRNQMQTLRALGYVDGVPGPKGGYTPSMKAYQVLGIEPVEKPHDVPLYKEGVRIEGVSAHKILFMKVTHPSECRAVISILGDTRKMEDGDVITIGPTPVNHVIIKGKVTGRDDVKREIMVDTYSITSIPKGKVCDIATRKLISLRSDMDIKECGKTLLANRINAAPIIDDERLKGIVTVEEIVRAITNDKKNIKAKDIAIRDIFTIGKESKLLTCIKKMEKLDVGRLIVTDEGRPVGIITRTDILQRMVK